MSSIILDLDNCIADDEWRISRINWQHENPFRRYHDYHMLSAFDEVGNTDLLDTEHDIIIFTARPVHYRSLTEEWLRRNGINVKYLLMRNDDDHCHSKDLKLSQLRWLCSEYDVSPSDIVYACDDRHDVVKMYNEFGITAIVRAIHNVCAYTKPPKETK